MTFKLPEGNQREALIELVNAIKNKNTVQSIILYGSYNKGTFQEGWSDVDIMVMLKEPLNAIQYVSSQRYRTDICHMKGFKNLDELQESTVRKILNQ